MKLLLVVSFFSYNIKTAGCKKTDQRYDKYKGGPASNPFKFGMPVKGC